MKKGLYFFLLIIASTSINAYAKFYVCKSKYALCTTAACTSLSGKNKLASCKCNVVTGYSAGTKPCKSAKQTRHGELIYSRYYPIKSYVACSNNRPWAWYLDMPCLIDKNNNSKASCSCSVVSNLGAYVIVPTSKNISKACTTGLISSATIPQSNEITAFLKTQKNLQPFPVKVYHEK